MTQAFNLSQLANNLNTSGQLDATDGLTGAVPVANGGTGLTSVGTSGNVLTSNGTAWVSSAPSGGSVNVQTFTSSGTWTKPATGTMCAVFCIGGGGGGGRSFDPDANSVAGGEGSVPSFVLFNLADLASTVTVTVGSAGVASTGYAVTGGNGGTTSFGSLVFSIGGRGGYSYTSGGEYIFAPQPSLATAITVSTNYGGAGNIARNPHNNTLNLGNNQTGLSFYANGAQSNATAQGSTQTIYGAGGTPRGSSATGNGAGGASGQSSAGNGSAGICRVVVW